MLVNTKACSRHHCAELALVIALLASLPSLPSCRPHATPAVSGAAASAADGHNEPASALVFTAGAFFAYGGTALYRVDPGNGRVVWSTPGSFGRPEGNDRALFAPHLIDGWLDATVVGFDPSTGAPEWSYSVAPRDGAVRAHNSLELSVHLRGEVLAVVSRPAGEVALFRLGDEPLTPHHKTLDLTVKNASDPQRLLLNIGDREIHVRPDGH